MTVSEENKVTSDDGSRLNDEPEADETRDESTMEDGHAANTETLPGTETLAKDVAYAHEVIQDDPQHEEVSAAMPVSDSNQDSVTVEAADIAGEDHRCRGNNEENHLNMGSSQEVEPETHSLRELGAKEELVVKLPVDFTHLHVGEDGAMSVLKEVTAQTSFTSKELTEPGAVHSDETVSAQTVETLQADTALPTNETRPGNTLLAADEVLPANEAEMNGDIQDMVMGYESQMAISEGSTAMSFSEGEEGIDL